MSVDSYCLIILFGKSLNAHAANQGIKYIIIWNRHDDEIISSGHFFSRIKACCILLEIFVM